VRAFQTLFSDNYYIALEKPAGFHSHPPEDKQIKIDPKWNALAIAERQFGQKLYPCHRLDKATSGILLFGRDSESAGRFQKMMQASGWEKQYFAFVRGRFSAAAVLNSALTDENGFAKEAITEVTPLFYWLHPELEYQDQARIFTLVEVRPQTGRFHQIRRHLSGSTHPIVGDNRHGDKKLNREFFSATSAPYLYLRFAAASFLHPYDGEYRKIQTRWPRQWHALFEKIGFCALRD
jgi:tRNA pseudouridine65 synthase